jgi:hypothetical protein
MYQKLIHYSIINDVYQYQYYFVHQQKIVNVLMIVIDVHLTIDVQEKNLNNQNNNIDYINFYYLAQQVHSYNRLN